VLWKQHFLLANREKGQTSKQAGRQAGRQAGEQASRRAGKQANRQASKQGMKKNMIQRYTKQQFIKTISKRNDFVTWELYGHIWTVNTDRHC